MHDVVKKRRHLRSYEMIRFRQMQGGAGMSNRFTILTFLLLHRRHNQQVVLAVLENYPVLQGDQFAWEGTVRDEPPNPG